jgi:hypothetical protein
VHEVVEDAADDGIASLGCEQQHFEHAIARGVCELLLDELERRTGAQDGREFREPRERDTQRLGSVHSQRVHRLVSDRPAAIDAARSPSPSGHAACTSRIRSPRRCAK